MIGKVGERVVEEALVAMERDEVQDPKRREGAVEAEVEVQVMLLKSLQIRLEVGQTSPKALETSGSCTQSWSRQGAHCRLNRQ